MKKRKPIILVDEDGIQTKAFYMDELERDGKLYIAVALDPNKREMIDEESVEMAVFRVDKNEQTNEDTLSALDVGSELSILNEIFYYRIQKMFEMSPAGKSPFQFDDGDIEERDFAEDSEDIDLDLEEDEALEEEEEEEEEEPRPIKKKKSKSSKGKSSSIKKKKKKKSRNDDIFDDDID